MQPRAGAPQAIGNIRVTDLLVTRPRIESRGRDPDDRVATVEDPRVRDVLDLYLVLSLPSVGLHHAGLLITRDWQIAGAGRPRRRSGEARDRLADRLLGRLGRTL